jgi:hypothetical protein
MATIATVSVSEPQPRLLDLDLSLPLDDVLGRCREVLEDYEFPTVRRWRESGGKVLATSRSISRKSWPTRRGCCP